LVNGWLLVCDWMTAGRRLVAGRLMVFLRLVGGCYPASAGDAQPALKPFAIATVQTYRRGDLNWICSQVESTLVLLLFYIS